MQCPGSREMESLYPEDQASEASIEGTAAHTVCAARIFNDHLIVDGATEEMLDGADLWYDTLSKVGNHHIEEKVDCSLIHPDMWGTPDDWAWHPLSMTLNVFEYKFGHRFVDVIENWQMIVYALGIYHSNTHLFSGEFNVKFTIVQPRCFTAEQVRTWTITKADLFGYVERLRDNAEESMMPKARTVTGSECRDCKARHACPTLANASYNVIQMFGEAVPFNLDNKQAGRELALMTEAVTVLQARLSGLEDDVKSRIKEGCIVPGWTTEQGVGRKRWSTPLAEILALGSMMGIDLSKPDAITPTQAIKAGIPAELVNSYSVTPLGAVKLVPFKAIKEFK